jgi:predicted metal-dependent peptidase
LYVFKSVARNSIASKYRLEKLANSLDMTIEAQKLISASILRLRMNSPFFATLAMFTRFLPSQEISTAGTDGKDIFYNEDFVRSLPNKQQDGLMLHEILHAALLHIPRRGARDREIWNIAADIVINGMIAQEKFCELPIGGLRNPQLENFTVEEVYELLQANPRLKLNHADLLEIPPNDVAGTGPGKTSDDNGRSRILTTTEKNALEAHWRNALQQAKIIAQSSQRGNMPAGLLRELEQITSPQLDWRSHLWRYLVQTPTDFQDYDRRFVGQGLYLETLSGESLRIAVAVDTSGSIDQGGMRTFLSEVRGILDAYPHIQCDLYYVDVAAYGPHKLDPEGPLPEPQGGGGTSFVPFFRAIEKQDKRPALSIYLTDGHGDFPNVPPEMPVLWVVTAGGLDLKQFPFGETVRLLSEG